MQLVPTAIDIEEPAKRSFDISYRVVGSKMRRNVMAGSNVGQLRIASSVCVHKLVGRCRIAVQGVEGVL